MSTDRIVRQKLQPFPRICFNASQNTMTNMLNLLGLVWVVCWVFCGFFSHLTISPFLCCHSLSTFRVLPFTATEALRSCYSIISIHAVSLW